MSGRGGNKVGAHSARAKMPRQKASISTISGRLFHWHSPCATQGGLLSLSPPSL
jgi:hypothetical protein